MYVNGGKNSGYQALNLAYHLGFKNIMLVGYDMKSPGKHWHGDHPKGWSNADQCLNWSKHFIPMARDLEFEGVNVVNCTIDTAITAFPKMTIREAANVLQF